MVDSEAPEVPEPLQCPMEAGHNSATISLCREWLEQALYSF